MYRLLPEAWESAAAGAAPPAAVRGPGRSTLRSRRVIVLVWHRVRCRCCSFPWVDCPRESGFQTQGHIAVVIDVTPTLQSASANTKLNQVTGHKTSETYKIKK